jgi:hypothetical protein
MNYRLHCCYVYTAGGHARVRLKTEFVNQFMCRQNIIQNNFDTCLSCVLSNNVKFKFLSSPCLHISDPGYALTPVHGYKYHNSEIKFPDIGHVS